ncbi:MAG TPA: gluconokinase [Solirubrobacteraceae bacterium]|nr:gluconokinase [Solirubrobacteraceae bacterium]
MSAGPPAEVIIGLDVGTTGVKAAAFGVSSSWRRVTIREYPLLEPALGQAVQNPADIIDAASAALRECVEGLAGAEILGISLSAAMHGLIGFDSTGRPLTPLITWADARAQDEAQSLRRTHPELHALTGVPVHPMTPLSKLAWFARHDPATLAGARWWGGLKELLLVWLTGQVVTELSSASGTGLLQLATRTWSPAAIELAGIRREQLPEILPTTSQLPLSPEAARTTGVRAGTPVLVGAADGPLGNLGTGALVPGVASLSLGTSGAVRMVVGEPSIDAHRTLFCYALTDDTWVTGGAFSNGASVTRWVTHALAPDLTTADGTPSDAILLRLAAEVPPGCDGLVMLPYLLSERAPLWDPALLGAYLGLRREHTRAHMARAAVEGVCAHMRQIVDRLDRVSPVSSVRATGGAFRSELWRQVMAAMLARPLQIVAEQGGTALGAAALGLYALGRAGTLRAAVTLISDPRAAPVVEFDPQLVEVYDDVRARIPRDIAELARVAELFAGAASPETGDDERSESQHRPRDGTQ